MNKCTVLGANSNETQWNASTNQHCLTFSCFLVAVLVFYWRNKVIYYFTFSNFLEMKLMEKYVDLKTVISIIQIMAPSRDSYPLRLLTFLQLHSLPSVLSAVCLLRNSFIEGIVSSQKKLSVMKVYSKDSAMKARYGFKYCCLIKQTPSIVNKTKLFQKQEWYFCYAKTVYYQL